MLVNYTTKELDLLARIMRAEAQTEGDLGMLMVGNVVVNRVIADCYTFKNIKLGNYTLPGLRLSLTADRPFTTFSANTFSPEIADASAEGWDTEVYPLTATYTFGVKIDF